MIKGNFSGLLLLRRLWLGGGVEWEFNTPHQGACKAPWNSLLSKYG